ncbi:Hypothetical protein NTJ_13820 [Nesidiocoris tenuis]|uniref:Uncharacterized protein n=1 Tax=Nesidiocoris tenuis TaxID=355587 RepID=A0ABN7B9R6_9HEMI|nr:Hypothetical protein NTJ_13820 [Nesidiocoris tenuis]
MFINGLNITAPCVNYAPPVSSELFRAWYLAREHVRQEINVRQVRNDMIAIVRESLARVRVKSPKPSSYQVIGTHTSAALHSHVCHNGHPGQPCPLFAISSPAISNFRRFRTSELFIEEMK